LGKELGASRVLVLGVLLDDAWTDHVLLRLRWLPCGRNNQAGTIFQTQNLLRWASEVHASVDLWGSSAVQELLAEDFPFWDDAFLKQVEFIGDEDIVMTIINKMIRSDDLTLQDEQHKGGVKEQLPREKIPDPQTAARLSYQDWRCEANWDL
jgi:hypothetical protein